MLTGQIQAQRAISAPLGGDRVYAAMRWLALVVIAGFGAARFGLTTSSPDLAHPAALVVIGYAAFTLLSTAVVLTPSLGAVVPWLYAGDLVAFAALAYTAPERSAAYENLFFLPLVAAALRCSGRRVVLL